MFSELRLHRTGKHRNGNKILRDKTQKRRVQPSLQDPIRSGKCEQVERGFITFSRKPGILDQGLCGTKKWTICAWLGE